MERELKPLWLVLVKNEDKKAGISQPYLGTLHLLLKESKRNERKSKCHSDQNNISKPCWNTSIHTKRSNFCSTIKKKKKSIPIKMRLLNKQLKTSTAHFYSVFLRNHLILLCVPCGCLRAFPWLLGSSGAIYNFYSAQSGLRSKISDRKVKHKVNLTQAFPTETLTLLLFSHDQCGVCSIP